MTLARWLMREFGYILIVYFCCRCLVFVVALLEFPPFLVVIHVPVLPLLVISRIVSYLTNLQAAELA